MSIEARAKLLMDELKVSQKELEAMSGISQQVWSKAFNGRQRMNSDHIEFLCDKFKDYAYWLATGSDESGLIPVGAKAVEYFSELANKYAETKAEYNYALMIEQYLSSSESLVDENGIAGSSPMPSHRKEMASEYAHTIMSEDFKALSKTLSKSDLSEVHNLIDQHFYEKSITDLSALTNQYGENHRITIMLSRMLTDFLIPGSKSNVIQPFAAQNPDNGVDKALLGK